MNNEEPRRIKNNAAARRRQKRRQRQKLFRYLSVLVSAVLIISLTFVLTDPKIIKRETVKKPNGQQEVLPVPGSMQETPAGQEGLTGQNTQNSQDTQNSQAAQNGQASTPTFQVSAGAVVSSEGGAAANGAVTEQGSGGDEASLQASINQSIAESEALQASIDQSIAESEALQASINQSIAESEALQASINQSIAESEALQASINQSIAESEAVQASIDQSIAESIAAETTVPPTAPAPGPGTYGNVHALTPDAIASIGASYDTNGRGYGGITFYQQAASFQNELNMYGNGRAVCGSGNVVAFTFQEGYEGGYTAQLLDILAAHGVKASFYITHWYAVSSPDLVQRMINEGHDVGSHTYACPELAIAYHPLQEIHDDAIRMQQYMQDAFGYSMTTYNYNSGAWSPAANVMLSQMGYKIAFCTTSYPDFDPNAAIDVNSILPQLEAALIPGSVYAFHVTNPATVQLIGPLIEYCQAMGYTIVVL